MEKPTSIGKGRKNTSFKIVIMINRPKGRKKVSRSTTPSRSRLSGELADLRSRRSGSPREIALFHAVRTEEAA